MKISFKREQYAGWKDQRWASAAILIDRTGFLWESGVLGKEFSQNGPLSKLHSASKNIPRQEIAYGTQK